MPQYIPIYRRQSIAFEDPRARSWQRPQNAAIGLGTAGEFGKVVIFIHKNHWQLQYKGQVERLRNRALI